MENKLVPGILIGAVIVARLLLLINLHVILLKQSFKDIKEGNRTRKPSKISSIKDEVMY